MFDRFRKNEKEKEVLCTLPGRHYRDLPGYGVRTVDDARMIAIHFEKVVFDYLTRKTGKPLELSLGKAIQDLLIHYQHDRLQGMLGDISCDQPYEARFPRTLASPDKVRRTTGQHERFGLQPRPRRWS